MKTWLERVSELEAAGWSLTRLGNEIGLSPQSLSDIKQGRSKEPRGMSAVRLYLLHLKISGEMLPLAEKKAA
jgi:transcriptional regulator with XRE-family HTH domain